MNRKTGDVYKWDPPLQHKWWLSMGLPKALQFNNYDNAGGLDIPNLKGEWYFDNLGDSQQTS